MAEPEFLDVASSFRLGMLDTERPHPKTIHLSEWAQHDLPRGIEVLREVDQDALRNLGQRLPSLIPLATEIHDVLSRGHKIYLCGCGATGRLSISLELFARSSLVPEATVENIIGFMAGGDAALIRSIERFEDHPEFGERQLRELGFGDHDLLISSTEGGETPFVIGATEAAARLSARRPFFLYGNPDDLLSRNVERSRRILESASIRKLNLATGPMALTGSTRMQASTVLMAAIGFSLKHHDSPAAMEESLQRWMNWLFSEVDWTFLTRFVELESQTYEQGDYVLYQPGPYGITVLTDTTERSPTFSLTPFERSERRETPSSCYLHLPGTRNATSAWSALLQRSPRLVQWGSLRHLTGNAAIEAFDFSDRGRTRRELRCAPAHNYLFRLTRTSSHLNFRFRSHTYSLPLPDFLDELGENLALKMLLNAHSTLVMGRLGRYQGNLMTYVSANNFKLIDRAIRYVLQILETDHQWKPSYETVARQLLEERNRLKADQPIVLQTVASLLKTRRANH